MSDTKDTIRERMLSDIDSTYDKSEGSFFYDVIASIAIELEKSYKNTDSILDKGFADTANDKNLEKIVGEVGLTRKNATKATGTVTITGTNGSKIVKGEMVASDNVNFLFLQDLKIENNSIDVLVECEKVGSVGNVPAGAIKYFPKTLSGLQSVINKSAFTNGYDEETNDSLRERYYTKVRTPATSGNKNEYLNWAKSVVGVGDAKVFPETNLSGEHQNGCVKVVIINSNKVGASADLINQVSTYIEENRPIGCTLYVASAAEKSINVSFILNLESGYTLENVKTTIENTLKNYLKEIAFVKDYVSYAKIGAFILDTDGVIDYSNLLVNNSTDNVSLGSEEVAILGGVVIG